MNPNITYLHDKHIFNYPDLEISLTYSDYKEREETMYLEVDTSRFPKAGLLYAGKFAYDMLGGQSGMKAWVDRLTDRSMDKEISFLEDVDWHSILLTTKQDTLTRWRKGAPSVALADVAPAGADKWLLYPFLQQGYVNIIFGDGGTGKSTLAQAIAVTLASGHPIMGADASKTLNVMYLDWEEEAEAHREIVESICRGASIPIPPNIRYRRMDRALAGSIRGVRDEVIAHDIGLVIVDSIGMAGGGDPERAGTKIGLFDHLRTLKGCTILALDHIAKGDNSSPYGSVYTKNQARLIWNVESTADEDSTKLQVTMRLNKINRGRKIGRRAYSLQYDTDENEILKAISFDRMDVMEIPKERDRSELWQLALHELKKGQMNINDLATAIKDRDGTAPKVDSLRTAMKRRNGTFQQSAIDPNVWQLKA